MGNGVLIMTIKAINKTHQKNVNKAYKAYRKYHACVNLEGQFPSDAGAYRNAVKQANAFEDYENAFGELNAREQVNFDKQHTTLHGYS